ncbi:TPA: hypothetical protein KON86_002868 [Clostridioides difficile]|nr:hypothetical protein [Clostridioides difficile]HBF4443236.1 hypothetical protein [Clostridioides difficile]HBG1420770.1 hypothetical protein [Clostridioides difficile]
MFKYIGQSEKKTLKYNLKELSKIKFFFTENYINIKTFINMELSLNDALDFYINLLKSNNYYYFVNKNKIILQYIKKFNMINTNIIDIILKNTSDMILEVDQDEDAFDLVAELFNTLESFCNINHIFTSYYDLINSIHKETVIYNGINMYKIFEDIILYLEDCLEINSEKIEDTYVFHNKFYSYFDNDIMVIAINITIKNNIISLIKNLFIDNYYDDCYCSRGYTFLCISTDTLIKSGIRTDVFILILLSILEEKYNENYII